MDNGSKIKVEATISNFELLDSFKFIGRASVGIIYTVEEMKEWKQRIKIFDKHIVNEFVVIDLFGLLENTHVFSINEDNLGINLFEEFCLTFGLQYQQQIKKHAKLKFNEMERLVSAAVKKLDNTDMLYLVIFYLDSGESRRKPILYIHGIWKISSSEDLINLASIH